MDSSSLYTWLQPHQPDPHHSPPPQDWKQPAPQPASAASPQPPHQQPALDLSDFTTLSDIAAPPPTATSAPSPSTSQASFYPFTHPFYGAAPYYGGGWPSAQPAQPPEPIPLSNYSTLNGATSSTASSSSSQQQQQQSQSRSPQMMIDPALTTMNGALSNGNHHPYGAATSYAAQAPTPQQQQQRQQQLQQFQYLPPFQMAYFLQPQQQQQQQGTLSPHALHAPTSNSLMNGLVPSSFYSQTPAQASSSKQPQSQPQQQHPQQQQQQPQQQPQPLPGPTPAERRAALLTAIRPLLQASAFTGAGAVSTLVNRLFDFGSGDVDAATRLEVLTKIRDGAGNHYFRAWAENPTAVDITREWLKVAFSASREAEGGGAPGDAVLVETIMPLLHIIDRLPMTVDSLKTSKLGKIVVKLVKDPPSPGELSSICIVNARPSPALKLAHRLCCLRTAAVVATARPVSTRPCASIIPLRANFALRSNKTSEHMYLTTSRFFFLACPAPSYKSKQNALPRPKKRNGMERTKWNGTKRYTSRRAAQRSRTWRPTSSVAGARWYRTSCLRPVHQTVRHIFFHPFSRIRFAHPRNADAKSKKRKLTDPPNTRSLPPLKKPATGSARPVASGSVKKEPGKPAAAVKDAKSDSSFFSAPKPKPKLPSFKKAPPPPPPGAKKDEPGVAQPSAIDPFQEALKSMKARKGSPLSVVSTPPPDGAAGTSAGAAPGYMRNGKRKKTVTWPPEGQLESVRLIEKAIYDDDPADGMIYAAHSLRDLDRSEGAALHAHLFEETVDWYDPLPIDIPIDVPDQGPRGAESQEKATQEQREQTALVSLYMSPASIPDSPAEPASTIPEEEVDKDVRVMTSGPDVDLVFWSGPPVQAPPPAAAPLSSVADLVGQLAVGMEGTGSAAVDPQLQNLPTLPPEQLQQLLQQLSQFPQPAQQQMQIQQQQQPYSEWPALNQFSADYSQPAFNQDEGERNNGWPTDGRGRGGRGRGRGRGRGFAGGGDDRYSQNKRKPCNFFAAGRRAQNQMSKLRSRTDYASVIPDANSAISATMPMTYFSAGVGCGPVHWRFCEAVVVDSIGHGASVY
ncbi:hypothetical protein B0H10DRAFT_1918313 [Mycena sp. CBHHK59/15]|nr:hypothetical protein B0H10DRAFT_1918313 [Mycena sp. CBHHK59/15]